MKTEGFVCVRVPIGHLVFLDTFMQKVIADVSMEFQKLISYPHQHDFLLMLSYCCNQKIIHRKKQAIGPHILLYSQQFGDLIDTTF